MRFEKGEMCEAQDLGSGKWTDCKIVKVLEVPTMCQEGVLVDYVISLSWGDIYGIPKEYLRKKRPPPKQKDNKLSTWDKIPHFYPEDLKVKS